MMKKSVIITLCISILAVILVSYPPAYSQFQNFGALMLGNTGTVGYINVKDTRYAGGAKGDGREVQDAGITSGLATVTSVTANFLTTAKVGQVVWATRDATGLAELPQGTITAINSNTSITASVAATQTRTNMRLRWGTDDTTALAAAVTATIAVGKNSIGLGTMYIPTGFYVCAKTVATSCLDYTGAGTGYNSVTVLGDGPNSSVIWPTPNILLGASGYGNCLDITGADFTVENFGCDGGLFSAAAGAVAAIGLHSTSPAGVVDNTPNLIMNVHVYGWHRFDAAATACGIYTGAQKTMIVNVAVEQSGCGAKMQGGGSAMVNSLMSNNAGYNLQLASSGAYQLGSQSVIKSVIDECGGTTDGCLSLVGQGDAIIADSTIYAGNSGIAMQVDGTSSVTISNSRITPYSNDTNGTGLKILAGGVARATNTSFRSSGTGAAINNAGTFTDSCGNVVETNVGILITNTGTFKNCFNQPAGSTCLLASAASPLACLTAGQGKVAIPINSATYTINTTAIEDNSTVEITGLTANNGIPGAPTCVAPTATSIPVVSAIVAKTSFTITQTLQANITCFAWRIATP